MGRVKQKLKQIYNKMPWEIKKKNKALESEKSKTFIRCYQGFADTNDCINKILLDNSSEIELSKIEKEECLNYYKTISNKKSENVESKKVVPIPVDWPKDLLLAPLPESTNDFNWKPENKKYDEAIVNLFQGLSIVIPTFNRSKLLEITLVCLVNQKTDYEFEVIVADDGSQESLSLVIEKFKTKLDITLVQQPDQGQHLCTVRNLGLRAAKYDFVAILDCDMAPNTLWVQSYMELLSQDDNVVLIGPRKYVDTQDIDPSEISIDWRLEHFKNTDNLRLCNTPFHYFSGGNVAFAKKWLHIVGWYDEEFTHWDGEDIEFGYRLYREGCFFRAVDGGMVYHQEPPGKAVTINIAEQKVPYFYRKLQKIESATIKKVPLVSIYIPAYNCENSIEKCIESALGQTVTDLEVCVCDDGSMDRTLELLKNKYAKNPRVRYMTQQNGGIGKASNSAVKMARGYYIAQLDSDDYLEPDAVQLCLKEFINDRKLACVYTTYRNVNHDGTIIKNGFNWSVYSRKKLTTDMICHHFRMFTARAWNLTTGFDEEITNAVDYDMYLKLSEIGPFKHINKICYNRVLHGENTSIKKLDIQKINHFIVVNNSLRRQKIDNWEYIQKNDNPSCRKYIFKRKMI